MNNLMLKEITMTSLEVVDLINQLRAEEGNDKEKRHDVLLRDIRKEVESLANAGIEGVHNFVESSYINSQNKEQPCFIMNKAGVMQMLNKESAAVRYKTQLYIEKLEKALQDIRFKVGDKKHQIECMALLQDILPEEEKQEKLNYIKINTVVNKITSNIYGFPKMLKKTDMNNQMLETREKVLDDYLKLFEVLEDNSLVTQTLNNKYKSNFLLVNTTM